MNSLVVTTPTVVLPLPAAAPVVLPQPAAVPAQTLKSQDEDTVAVSQAAKQQQSAATVQTAASADLYPISDKTFTVFKDSTGKYITRYTSLRDGKVTYVPTPADIVKLSQSDSTALNIKV